MWVKRCFEESSDSKSSDWKVFASLPRPCRKMIVCVCGAMGETVCGLDGVAMVETCKLCQLARSSVQGLMLAVALLKIRMSPWELLDSLGRVAFDSEVRDLHEP